MAAAAAEELVKLGSEQERDLLMCFTLLINVYHIIAKEKNLYHLGCDTD